VTCLADVHLGAGSAGDLVDHACPVIGLNTGPSGVQASVEGLVGAEAGTDAQGGEDPMY